MNPNHAKFGSGTLRRRWAGTFQDAYRLHGLAFTIPGRCGRHCRLGAQRRFEVPLLSWHLSSSFGAIIRSAPILANVIGAAGLTFFMASGATMVKFAISLASPGA